MKIKHFVLCLLCILAITGCDKSDENIIYFDGHTDTYYIKYTYNVSSGSRHFCSFNAVYTVFAQSDDISERTISYSGKANYEDEITCGPFKYGDKVELKIENEFNVYERSLEIHVSKNNSSFALKTFTNGPDISYTVDY